LGWSPWYWRVVYSLYLREYERNIGVHKKKKRDWATAGVKKNTVVVI